MQGLRRSNVLAKISHIERKLQFVEILFCIAPAASSAGSPSPLISPHDHPRASHEARGLSHLSVPPHKALPRWTQQRSEAEGGAVFDL